MSELHFDAEGEPAQAHPGAAEIRWRRFRNPGMRGAPEVVHEKDGSPLYTTTDITYVEFRARVDGAPGRYRGDQVDATRRVIPNATPFYVTINETPRNGNAAGVADDRDLIREVVRANVEMTRMMSDRFGGMMESAASMMRQASDLLRAADGANLPRREPLAAEVDDGDDEDEDETDDDKPSDLVQVFQQVAPMIQMYIATKVGGGKADDKDEPAPRGDKPSPGATPTSSPPSAPSSSRPAPVATAAAPRNAAAAITPAQMAHVVAVQARLTPDEARTATAAAMRMPPDARAQWVAELCARSIDDAAALIRSNLPDRPRSADPAPTVTPTP